MEKTAEAILTNMERICWKPVIGKGNGLSQFGGNPLLVGDWPVCQECHAPMPLFLQLDLKGLPDGHHVQGEGVLQLFYCTECDEAFEPFSPCQLARLVTGGKTPNGKARFKLKRIVNWEALPDYPCVQEVRASQSQRVDDFVETHQGFRVKDGDKLGGWPYWIQVVELPKCPQCRRNMQMIFQIDSNDNLDWMFGDVGCGHLSQCLSHPEVLSFHWACG